MDIRGIEVTNQLRSAIRAKLLELGVRYDEELPDYILVMVVNKKSRQQMHEDLHLFLETNTASFVEWLHDQVLKKLQKVTVAKKKTTREFLPAVIIKQEESRKQEEERKKRKTATSFLEDQGATEVAKKLLGKNLKEDKQIENETTMKVESSKESTDISQKDSKKSTRETESKSQPMKPSSSSEANNSSAKKVIITSDVSSKSSQSLSKSNPSQSSESKSSKLEYEITKNSDLSKSNEQGKRSRNFNEEDESIVSDSKRLKSSVIKPKITSVVSIKNRLGIISPRKKIEFYQDRVTVHKPKQSDHHFEHRNNFDRKNNFPRLKNSEFNDDSRKTRDFDAKLRGSEKTIDIRNRIGNFRGDRPNLNVETREKINTTEKSVPTIKNRLGSSSNSKMLKQSTVNIRESEEDKKIDRREERSNFKGKNVKYRLGSIRKNFRAADSRGPFKSFSKNMLTEKERNFRITPIEEDDDDDDQSIVNIGPVKSHIVAVQKPLPEKSSRKRLKSDDKHLSDSDEQLEDCKVPSKVIVTPRPLKPLLPTQKRATQSLLLRAVAEANQSVVTQKNPEPSLVQEEKSFPKRSKHSGSWAAGQNLSVHLDSQKRFVMEKIQVELTTVKKNDTKPYDSREVTDEHIGVVRSLFHQSNNDQKFLVTLNGYNNNLSKEKTSDIEESLEMEVNKNEEQELLINNSDEYQQNESDSVALQVSNSEDDDDSNNSKQSNNDENQNTENIEVVDEKPRESRKLSPIIYNRSRSATPELRPTKVSTIPVTNHTNKKFNDNSVPVTIIAESEQVCRYWPNCTLGKKCAYYHPGVPCSAFPACKFGQNCTYIHPKCKFGSACTKLGCVFSHPSETCKYHPYCSKPSCPYTHPLTKPTLPDRDPNQRAKFTWKRRN